MKKDIYKINHNIERLLSGNNTLFLDGKEYNLIKNKIKLSKYNIYKPYKDSEKLIIYNTNKPKVSLYKINSYEKLRHQEILGSIMALDISPNYLGDIIIDGDNYYFYIVSSLDEYIENNLLYCGNKSIKLEKIDVDFLKDYEREYEEYEIIVSSLRIDNVISKIIGTNRNKVLDMIKNKYIILNYDILTKPSYILKEGDIFSVRRYGKYKFVGITNTTKKDKLIIKYKKY